MFMLAYTVFVDESRIQRRVPPHLSDIVLELGVYLTCKLLFMCFIFSILFFLSL